MPSRKEGFGLVLIEAAATGIPVIAGNADGSVEAMQHGTLGRLVNPEDPNEILMAIEAALNEQRGINRQRAMDLYESKKYVQALNGVLNSSI
jgi:glycosyltransferase involved in cell wall biosynthesis